ncbi:MAG TPA: DNA polymerase ligase N-terminal domain-containing protein [Chthoniobacterales bacterium]|nr:DNA polymerase ligase N-terminal domain-containing protein [Chthoniobacterales bacterium]
MSLREYRSKRNFRSSPEPLGKISRRTRSQQAGLYVIQKHRASHLHYDFRLEFNGVLLSWAIPKGPSLDPSVKRLAMQVEDHPLEYARFEGVIPEGYGAGTVMVWDIGSWTPEVQDVAEALQKGDMKLTLRGKKLHGSWALVRTAAYGGRKGKSWLLIKHRDRYASTVDITIDRPRSVLTRRLLAEIARDSGGDVIKAADGDPAVRKRSVAASRPPARRR